MKTLIILHGWQSSKERWQTVKQELEQFGRDPLSANFAESGSLQFKIIVPDLPGFKKETKLSRPWDLDDYIDWLENFISKNSKTSCPDLAERFYLLGHSFGGRMAIKFAAKYPEKLKGLILVSAAGIKTKQNVFYLNFLAGARFIKSVLLKIPLLRNFFPFFRKLFYKYILRRTDYINAEKMPELQETFKKVIAEDLTQYLSQIKTPTLIIWGDKDKMTPLKDAYLMKEKIKNSKLEILRGVGHTPHLENPEILSQKIQNFIENTNKL